MRRLLLILVLLLPASAHAWPRLGYSSQGHFNDTGTKRDCFTYTVTSTAAVIYTARTKDREILFQNVSSSNTVYIGTHTAVSDTTGRMMVRGSSDLWTDNSGTLYGVTASGLTAGLVGCVEFDAKD